MLNVAEVIRKCGETGSTLSKQQILRDNDTEILRKVLNYALDPYKVFGIKKFVFANPANFGMENKDWGMIFNCCDKLIKRDLTGDAARGEIFGISGIMSANQQFIFERILWKDLKCGVAEGIVNKVFPKLIPEFEVQLAQPTKFMKRVTYPCLVQAKLDGVRTIALVDPIEKSVIYYSRNGKQFMNFGCFDNELLTLAKYRPRMFDGEVVGPSGEDFVGIMQQCRRKYDVEPKGLNFHIFDSMPILNFASQKYTDYQINRTDYLIEIASFVQEDLNRCKIVRGKICNNEQELMQYYDECVTKGYEGVIIKDLKGEYEFKRSVSWIKMKPDTSEDLKVVDIQEGTGKYKGLLGALVVDREGIKVNVGSGFKDSERIRMAEAIEGLVGKTVEIKYDTVTPDGSLRFPRFIKVREDK